MKPSLRIALYHNLPSGGAKRALYEWVRRLADTHQLDVYTLSTANHAFCDIRPFVRQHFVFDFTPHQLFESPLGRLNQWQRWRDLSSLTRMGRHIAHQINRGDYDVVFAHPCLYTFIPTMLQFVQLPSVYYLHEPFGRTFTRQFRRDYLKENKWRVALNRLDPLIWLYHYRLNILRRQSIRRTTRLLANSEFTRQQMLAEFDIDTPVSHYGVNFEGFCPMPEVSKGDHLLSVGELSPRKGFDFLVESMAHIPAEQRPVLKLACNSIDPLELEYVRQLANQRGVKVEILTKLNSEELALEYNKARFCIYSPVLEPFGLVPLESMACGTPVVGVREGGVQETIVDGQTGLLAERNPQKFASAIQHLLANPDLVAKYGRKGREHVLQNWSWEKSTASLEDHLIDCAGISERVPVGLTKQAQ